MIIIVAGSGIDGDSGEAMYPKQSDRNYSGPSPSNSNEFRQLPPPPKNARPKSHDRESQLSKIYNPQNLASDALMVKDRHIPLLGHGDVQSYIASSNLRANTVNDPRFVEGGQMVSSNPSREFTLDIEDLDIPWSDLVLKEKIGAGNLVWLTVHKLYGGCLGCI